MISSTGTNRQRACNQSARQAILQAAAITAMFQELLAGRLLLGDTHLPRHSPGINLFTENLKFTRGIDTDPHLPPFTLST